MQIGQRLFLIVDPPLCRNAGSPEPVELLFFLVGYKRGKPEGIGTAGQRDEKMQVNPGLIGFIQGFDKIKIFSSLTHHQQ